MATSMMNAAQSVVGTALAPFKDSLLEKWAASVRLGANVKDLELELLAVQALLEHTADKEITDSDGLKKLLVKLQDLGYDADDVLDELEYFRIQDDLDNSSEAADEHAKGGLHNLALHADHTAKAVVKQIWLPACFSGAAKQKARNSSTISSAPQQSNREAKKAKLASMSCCNTNHAVGKCFPSSSLPCAHDNDDDDDDDDNDDSSMHNSPDRNHTTEEPPKLTFNRVEASQRMQHIVEQLQRVRRIVFETITALGSNWSNIPNIAQSRSITISESTEARLFGRDHIMNSMIHDITQGKHSREVLTVIPIVGPGGIGKTTLAQYIYHSEKVQKHFDVKVWQCVSLNFNVNKLTKEIKESIPEDKDEKNKNGTAEQSIDQRLKNKRFLLILDDMWDCSNEDDWKQLLVPFKKSQVLGNIIIVTTRLPAQEQMVKTVDHSIALEGLDHQELKQLFLKIVFGDDDQSRNSHPSLLDLVDNKIIGRLKGSPLAAKTVGRLLKSRLDLFYWTRVLESKEWEQQKGKDDIMPVLKLSYDYLPSQLQRCFSYCAMFPQDYKFEIEELVNFWIGLDVLHPSPDENKRVEDIGATNLEKLVDNGFFEKKERKDGSPFYILHDLFHDLARKVSSHECLSIQSSLVRSLKISPSISPSIRHLSITIDDASIENRSTLKRCVEDFNTLDKILKIEKLRSLMLFGEHHPCFLKPLRELFSEAKALRVVFLCKAPYNVEDLLHNFYNLVHLRYLRIQSSSLVRTRFPNKLSRFYHMIVIDAKHCDIIDLPKDMGNLKKLRHFLVKEDATHSSIVEVGKLETLQELRKFLVKEEGQGFELRQLGQLVDLRGSLCIADLENVQVKEEAESAELKEKSYLQELMLCWSRVGSTNDSALEQDVLERLQPSSNLLKLSIIGHNGATCPSWLGRNLSVKNLESLCLNGVAWEIFPPIGEMWPINGNVLGNTPNQRLANLKRLELVKLPRLKKWVVDAPCELFPHLEVLVIRGCYNLVQLMFSHFACCQQESSANLFPRLSSLVVQDCPRLLSFPPIPWTKAPDYIDIKGIGSPPCLRGLFCEKKYYSECSLSIQGTDTPHSKLWDLLTFDNLTNVKEFAMNQCPPLPLHHLQMLSSLSNLTISNSSTAFPFVEGDSHVQYEFPVEQLTIVESHASGTDLTRLLNCFPKLSCLILIEVTMQDPATDATSSSDNTVDEAQIELDQLQDARPEDEIVAECLLLLPPQLQTLEILWCRGLSLCFSQFDDTREDVRTGGGVGGFQGLSSLRKLIIRDCPRLLCSYSSSCCFSFPNSLEELCLQGEVGLLVPAPLSNLTSLTSLTISKCANLRIKGLLSLLTQGNLTKLDVEETPYFFAGSEPLQELPSRPSKLQELSIDNVARFNPALMRGLLFPSLTKLGFWGDGGAGSFTEEQEGLLFSDSLEEIRFWGCSSLQYLPARLHTLPHLKRLRIQYCESIQMLPKDGLPCSLQELELEHCPEIQLLPKDSLPSSLKELEIKNCPKIRALPKDCLPSLLQKLEISRCPAIQLLPKVDDLPSSLREIDVCDRTSEELRRQCRKLKGIIPIVRA